jgi:hypothetical protein
MKSFARLASCGGAMGNGCQPVLHNRVRIAPDAGTSSRRQRPATTFIAISSCHPAVSLSDPPAIIT